MKSRALSWIILTLLFSLVAFTGCVSAEDVAKQVDSQVQIQVQSQIELLKQQMQVELKSELTSELEAFIAQLIDKPAAEIFAQMDVITADYQKILATTAQFKLEISNELATVLSRMGLIEADYQKLVEVFFAIADSYRQ
jgi:GTPase involved in cell partitioning and DNA repair